MKVKTGIKAGLDEQNRKGNAIGDCTRIPGECK
jgi:hypothetical protein